VFSTGVTIRLRIARDIFHTAKSQRLPELRETSIQDADPGPLAKHVVRNSFEKVYSWETWTMKSISSKNAHARFIMAGKVSRWINHWSL